MGAGGGTGAVGRSGIGRKATIAVLSGSLAILPALVVSDSTARLFGLAEDRTTAAPLLGGSSPELSPMSVDGSLPDSVLPEELQVPEEEEPSSGSFGIPESVLAAYKKAAARVAAEYPGCNIDWALLASIGRIESNHARGGYVDTAGDTLEPILGPVLDGQGDVAAIPDTDGGRYDGDTTWDRAVGPMQFIPSTWARYAADGNGDGVADPNNIHDAALAAGRYLCSGGLDLSDSQQLRTAIYRYNNSWAYVDAVIRWAKAYRNGVLTLPDSELPAAVPETLLAHGVGSGHDVSSGAQLPSGGPKPDEPTQPSPPAPTLPGEVTEPEKPDDTDSPTSPPESSDPAEPPESEEPTDPPGTGEPTDPPETGDPTDPPETGEPSDPPETGDPTDPPETGDPTEPPETGDPTEPPESEEPTDPGCEPDEDSNKPEEGETPEETSKPSMSSSSEPRADGTGSSTEEDPTEPSCEDEEDPEEAPTTPEPTQGTKESDED